MASVPEKLRVTCLSFGGAEGVGGWIGGAGLRRNICGFTACGKIHKKKKKKSGLGFTTVFGFAGAYL